MSQVRVPDGMYFTYLGYCRYMRHSTACLFARHNTKFKYPQSTCYLRGSSWFFPSLWFIVFFPRTFLEDARRNTELSPNTSRRVWIDASVQIRKISPSLKKNVHDVWKHRCQRLSDRVFHYIIDIFGDKIFRSIQQSMPITHWHTGIGKYGLLSNSLW